MSTEAQIRQMEEFWSRMGRKGPMLPGAPVVEVAPAESVRQESALESREREIERRMRYGALTRHKGLMRKYGLTEVVARYWLAATYGPCEICLELPPEDGRHCVDHCHRTGALRGVLCGRCNTLVGYLENSNPAVLYSARLYIDRHKDKELSVD